MKPVESYVAVLPEDIDAALISKDFLPFQGSSLLFPLNDYHKTDVKTFLESIFQMIDKIAMEGKDKKYFILSNKFSADVIEPFPFFQDISHQFSNDIEKIAACISLGYTTPYGV